MEECAIVAGLIYSEMIVVKMDREDGNKETVAPEGALAKMFSTFW